MSGSDVCSSGKPWLQHTRYPLCDCASVATYATAVTGYAPLAAEAPVGADYDSEHDRATKEAEQYITVDGPGDVTGKYTVALELEPDVFIILERPSDLRRAHVAADGYRAALADVLIDYTTKRALPQP